MIKHRHSEESSVVSFACRVGKSKYIECTVVERSTLSVWNRNETRGVCVVVVVVGHNNRAIYTYDVVRASFPISKLACLLYINIIGT